MKSNDVIFLRNLVRKESAKHKRFELSGGKMAGYKDDTKMFEERVKTLKRLQVWCTDEAVSRGISYSKQVNILPGELSHIPRARKGFGRMSSEDIKEYKETKVTKYNVDYLMHKARDKRDKENLELSNKIDKQFYQTLNKLQ